jgi:carbonic anhydrase/acetyltransferase-like protein (isoleucine patch superfamily)
VPPGSLVMGSPGKVVRALTAEEQAANARLALKYVEVSRCYLAQDLGELIEPSSAAVAGSAPQP